MRARTAIARLRSLRIALALPALLALAACAGEPDALAIQSSLEQMHQEWAEQQRQNLDASRPRSLVAGLPRLDLGTEARLDLRITGVRKRSCRPAAGELLGYVCVAEVHASIAGHKPVARTIQGRFVSGWSQWVARDVQPVEVN